MAKVEMVKEEISGPLKYLMPGFRVKIPDVEIEFYSSDVKEVHRRFDEVMTYLKEILNSKTDETQKGRKGFRR